MAPDSTRDWLLKNYYQLWTDELAVGIETGKHRFDSYSLISHRGSKITSLGGEPIDVLVKWRALNTHHYTSTEIGLPLGPADHKMSTYFLQPLISMSVCYPVSGKTSIYSIHYCCDLHILPPLKSPRLAWRWGQTGADTSQGNIVNWSCVLSNVAGEKPDQNHNLASWLQSQANRKPAWCISLY